jgi:sigma-E factor negative regulatory protein RseB
VMRQILWGLGLWLVVGYAWAEAESPEHWLEKAVRAAQQLSYRGTFVYHCDAQVHTVSVTQQRSAEGVSEHLVAMDGQPREVKSANGMMHYQRVPAGGVAFAPIPVRGNPLQHASLAQLQVLKQYYQLKLGDLERLLDRSARLLSILPRDQWRYGYRLWVDHATGLVLKSEMVDRQGRLLERMVFTSVTIDPEQAVAETDVPAPATDVGGGAWLRFIDVPPGFAVQAFEARREASGSADHWTLSDGLATVSVFVEDMGETRRPFVGISKMGGVKALGKVIDERQLTVVGELPDAALRRIVEGIRADRSGPLDHAP